MLYRNAPAHIRAAINQQARRWVANDGTPLSTILQMPTDKEGERMKKVVYHPGTGTYWSNDDEWMRIQVPDSVSDADMEVFLIAFLLDATNHERHKCPECGVHTAVYLSEEARHG